jgi:hypothetical protein
MRIIITEEQFNRFNLQLSEQGMGTMFTPQYHAMEMSKIVKMPTHELNAILGLATAFIPVIGPFISAGIGALDALQYYQEGDNKSAAIATGFSLLPFIGPVVSKIPGVKQLGAKGMAALASKVGKTSKFTQTEAQVLKSINANKSLVTNELKATSSILNSLKGSVSQFKPSYVQRFGKSAYDDLLKKLVSKKITKEQFIGTLKKGKVASPKLSNFATKFGVKFSQEELQSIKAMTNGIKTGKTTQIVSINTKNGVKQVKINVFDPNMYAKTRPELKNIDAFAKGDGIFVNKNIVGKADLDELIGHELAHIKDPSMVSSKLNKTYNTSSVKNYNLHPYEINAVTSAALQTLTNTTKSWMKYLPKEQLMGYLDDILRYTKGEKVFDANSLKMIGKDGLDQLILYYKNDKKTYRNVLTKIAKQANYLKSQVNIAM